MADPTPNFNPTFAGFKDSLFRGDILLALGVIAIITVLIFPMPTWLLDMSLALSMTLSVMVLMTVLFLERPLDFSTFPTVLLIVTMLRLALNLASTRLILANGHEGPLAAGDVIGAFGGFIMQDNFVIGIIVFSILVLVNFVVITKGSGRIAEVAARFSLDAMPGKQMAIDADMSAGMITEDEARERRKTLEEESNFFGSMDGAAKFVRGDAIAGLLITIINVIGGIIIGTAQMGALFTQFGKYPRALALTSVLMIILALLPGIPPLPFLFLGAGAGVMAWFGTRNLNETTHNEEQLALAGSPEQQQLAKPAEEPISETLAMDTIRLELGYGLLSLVNSETGNKLTDQIKGLRRQLAEEMGFILPSVRIQDNLQLQANDYSVRIKEIGAGGASVRPGMHLCMDPSGEPITLPGESTTEPTFGLPAMWIDDQYKEEANFKGYTVVDAAIAEAANHTKNISMMTEHVRSRLGRQICNQHAGLDGVLLLVTLSAEWEQAFAESIIGDAEDRQLAMAPTKLQEFIKKVSEKYEDFGSTGINPVIVTSPYIRPYLRTVIERFRPQTFVMSQNEIHAKAQIRTMGSI